MGRQTLDLSYELSRGYRRASLSPQVFLQYGQMEESVPFNFKAVLWNKRKIPVDVEQVKEYQANDFKIKEIAHLIGLKKCTLKRTIALYGCNMRTSYSKITDEELGLCITVARKQFPNFGLQLIKGKLTATGMKVQDSRQRASYNRVGIKPK